MRVNTIRRKKARAIFEQALGKEELVKRIYQIIKTGNPGVNGFAQELGVMLVEAIMDIERRGLGLSKKILWVTDERKGLSCFYPTSGELDLGGHQVIHLGVA